jgi:arginyl-tRNA synthetase
MTNELDLDVLPTTRCPGLEHEVVTIQFSPSQTNMEFNLALVCRDTGVWYMHTRIYSILYNANQRSCKSENKTELLGKNGRNLRNEVATIK